MVIVAHSHSRLVQHHANDLRDGVDVLFRVRLPKEVQSRILQAQMRNRTAQFPDIAFVTAALIEDKRLDAVYFMAPVNSAFVFRLLPRRGPPNTVVLPLPFTKGVKKKGVPWRVSYTNVYSS